MFPEPSKEGMATNRGLGVVLILFSRVVLDGVYFLDLSLLKLLDGHMLEPSCLHKEVPSPLTGSESAYLQFGKHFLDFQVPREFEKSLESLVM